MLCSITSSSDLITLTCSSIGAPLERRGEKFQFQSKPERLGCSRARVMKVFLSTLVFILLKHWDYSKKKQPETSRHSVHWGRLRWPGARVMKVLLVTIFSPSLLKYRGLLKRCSATTQDDLYNWGILGLDLRSFLCLDPRATFSSFQTPLRICGANSPTICTRRTSRIGFGPAIRSCFCLQYFHFFTLPPIRGSVFRERGDEASQQKTAKTEPDLRHASTFVRLRFRPHLHVVGEHYCACESRGHACSRLVLPGHPNYN